MFKMIGRFIMQLNENRIKGYILNYNQKCVQKLIKTSHIRTYEYNNLFYFVEK